MRTPIRTVSRDVGMNPIARAVARQLLERSIRDTRIAMHMLDHNEPCLDRIGTLPLMLRAMHQAMPVQALLSERVAIARAIRILVDIEVREGRWRLDDLAPMDEALDILAHWWPQVPAQEANQAIKNAKSRVSQ